MEDCWSAGEIAQAWLPSGLSAGVWAIWLFANLSACCGWGEGLSQKQCIADVRQLGRRVGVRRGARRRVRLASQ